MSKYDESRIHDLQHLKERLDDASLQTIERQKAERAYSKVKKTIADPKLRKLRKRLIQANKMGSAKDIATLENAIHKYERKSYDSDNIY